MLKLALIDDNIEFATIYKNKFPKQQVEVFTSAYDFLEKFDNTESYDALLIDLKMPEMDGLTLFQNLSEKYNELPPGFILSEANDSNFRVSALKFGFFDYLHKDMSDDEIELRIKRAVTNKKGRFEFKELNIDSQNTKCYLDSEEIDLTKREFEVLQQILKSTSQIIDRDELINKIWKRPISYQTLATHIFNINLKLANFSHRLLVNNQSQLKFDRK